MQFDLDKMAAAGPRFHISASINSAANSAYFTRATVAALTMDFAQQSTPCRASTLGRQLWLILGKQMIDHDQPHNQ
jgi:hypothetical protein